jgi:hypothetical protein
MLLQVSPSSPLSFLVLHHLPCPSFTSLASLLCSAPFFKFLAFCHSFSGFQAVWLQSFFAESPVHSFNQGSLCSITLAAGGGDYCSSSSLRFFNSPTYGLPWRSQSGCCHRRGLGETCTLEKGSRRDQDQVGETGLFR